MEFCEGACFIAWNFVKSPLNRPGSTPDYIKKSKGKWNQNIPRNTEFMNKN